MASSRHYSFAVIAIVLLVYVWALKVSFLSGYLKHASLTKAIPSNNIAVIIEDRPLPTLTPLLLHFSTVLGPSWPIIFYTRSPNPTNSSSFQRAIDDGRIEIRQLPDDITFTDQESVSEFLTSPWIWEQLAPASHVLVFQADSIVCSNSPSKIDDFLQYDFIGAPIATPSNPRNGHGEGFNGGFSLRNRQMMLDVLAAHDWKAEMQTARYGDIACDTTSPCLKFEDQWFYHKLKEWPGANLPSFEVARTFSVETVWFGRPFGFHQVERWNERHLGEVREWCPEYALATEDLLAMHS